jgi:hypothetical protein
MPLTKKKRDRLWNGYIVGMIVFYGLTFALGTFLSGSATIGFVAGFASLFVSMIGFLILMRRLGAPSSPRHGP